MLSGKPASGVEVTKWNLITTLDASQIKAALAQSPVAAVVNGDCNPFSYYKGGIFDGITSAGEDPCSDELGTGYAFQNV